MCPGLLWLDSHHFIAQAGPVTAPPQGPAGLVRRINRVGQVDMFIPTVMCILESDWDQVTSYTRPAGWMVGGTSTRNGSRCFRHSLLRISTSNTEQMEKYLTDIGFLEGGGGYFVN